MTQDLKQPNETQGCQRASVGVNVRVVSTGPGRVQRWLVGYVERWEDDEGGYVSKRFLRDGWHLHEVAGVINDEHPIPGLPYTTDDAFEDRVTRHPKHRSHSESARRAIARLCKEGALEESPDKRAVRLPVVTPADQDLARRLDFERQYLKAHGQIASDDVLVAITGNIVVIELERQLTVKERMSFTTRCIERGDSAAERVKHLVDYVATKAAIPRNEVLGKAVTQARSTIAMWKEEDR